MPNEWLLTVTERLEVCKQNCPTSYANCSKNFCVHTEKSQHKKTLAELDDKRLLKHDSKYGNPLFVCLPDCRVCALLRESGASR